MVAAGGGGWWEEALTSLGVLQLLWRGRGCGRSDNLPDPGLQRRAALAQHWAAPPRCHGNQAAETDAVQVRPGGGGGVEAEDGKRA